MNKTELEDRYGDLVSFSAPERLGETNYHHVGFFYHPTGRKIPVVKCDICAADSELHGDGLFISSPKGLKSHAVGCGCSAQFKWSESQYATRISRTAAEHGYKFLGFVDDGAVNTYSRCIIECSKHGINNTAIVNSIISKSKFSCKLCAYEEKIMKNNGGIRRSIVVDSLYMEACTASVNSLIDNRRTE